MKRERALQVVLVLVGHVFIPLCGYMPVRRSVAP